MNITATYYKGYTLSSPEPYKIRYLAPVLTGGDYEYKNAKACIVAYSRESNKRILEPRCGFSANDDIYNRNHYLEIFGPYEDMMFYLFIGGDTVDSSSYYFYLPQVKTS